MRDKVTINGYEFSKAKIGSTEYRVSVFYEDKLEFQFYVSLQPTGKDDGFPTYQLIDKSQQIPSWIIESLGVILS